MRAIWGVCRLGEDYLLLVDADKAFRIAVGYKNLGSRAGLSEAG